MIQSYLSGLQTIPWISWLALCTDTVSYRTLYRQVCAFPIHGQSMNLPQVGSNQVAETSDDEDDQQKQGGPELNFEHNGKGCEYLCILFFKNLQESQEIVFPFVIMGYYV